MLLLERGMIGKSVRVQLASQIRDRGNDAGSGAVHGIANDSIAAIAHGCKTAPTGAFGERVKIGATRFGVRLCEDEVIRLEASHFFEAYLRPSLRSVNDGGGARQAESIGDEGIRADGDERIRPNDKEDASGRITAQALPQLRELAFKVRRDRCASFRRAQNIREAPRGRDDLPDGVRIDGIGRNAKLAERIDRLKAIQLCDQDEIRAEGDDFFNAGIDGAADFGFFPGIRRKITVIGVADEAVLQAQGVESFRRARREGDDALHGLRDTNRAAGFVNHFFVSR